MNNTRVILGLDLGVNSIGWALLEEIDKKPARTIACGSRIFEQCVEGSIEEGKDVPLATERRGNRQVRRQLDRRSMRRVKTMRLLQLHGMLPDGETETGKQRQHLINELDKRLNESMLNSGREQKDINQLPYFLRAIALDIELPPEAFGRTIYHLCQRRGYKSNRKDASKEDAEKGKVNPAINSLAKEITDNNCRTLGEYFNSLDPHKSRLRQRYTARKMYEHEFNELWDAQQRHNPKMYTDSLRDELHDCIFFQRPLKSQKGLIGRCELEPQRKRASFATLAAQKFRYIQKVNDLRVKHLDGDAADLSQEQREILYAAAEDLNQLDAKHNLTFSKMKSLLGLKPAKEYKFNLEEGGEKSIPGNKSAAKIQTAIGSKWHELDEQTRKDIVGVLMGGAEDERLLKLFEDKWGFTASEATALSKVGLEDTFCSLSVRAINKLLPLMAAGTSFASAKLEIYGDTLTAGDRAFDLLPPLECHVNPDSGEIPAPSVVTKQHKQKERYKTFKILSIRNPVVHRVLSQTRQVVNNIIREYGKPDMIRVEMARDIKKPREVRKEISKNNRSLEKERDIARKFLEDKCQIQNPKRADIEKYMLWQECNEICPFTGKSIPKFALFGDEPEFDIEHIIPFSRSLDNSYMNKTLCEVRENRHVKKNQTPFEAYAGNQENWDAMLLRVENFKSNRAKAKFERFRAEDTKSIEEFTSRHLNDTRYASKEAKKYLGMLYGTESHKRIQVSTGQLTSELRNAWQLNSILNDGGTKTREDHRHHAVDAIVIAMISPAMTKAMMNASKRYFEKKGRERGWWKMMELPWETFYDDCKKSIEEITVSHMYNRKARGSLHEGSNYTEQRIDPETETAYVAIRKNLGQDFKLSDIESIIDPAVRDAVMDHFTQYGSDSKKAFGDIANHPVMNGIPIHKVRIRKNSAVDVIGNGDNQRQIILGNNHHVEVIEFTDKKGNPKWDFVVVSMFEVMQRVKNKEPMIKRDHGEGKKFIMSLCKRDSVIMEDTEGNEKLYVVRKFDKNGIMFFKEHTDARLAKDIPAKGNSRMGSSFMKSNPRKVTITPLGKIYPCHD